jgi:hypothetical protein
LPVYPNKPKLLAVGQPASNLGYKNWFFEIPPTVSFQKTNFGVSSAKGAGNTKIGFFDSLTSVGCQKNRFYNENC